MCVCVCVSGEVFIMWTRHLSVCTGASSVGALCRRAVIKHCSESPYAVRALRASALGTFQCKDWKYKIGILVSCMFSHFLERLVRVQQSIKSGSHMRGCSSAVGLTVGQHQRVGCITGSLVQVMGLLVWGTYYEIVFVLFLTLMISPVLDCLHREL